MYTRFIVMTLSFSALFTSLGLGLEYIYSPKPLLMAEAHAKVATAPSTVIQPLTQVLSTGAVNKRGLYELPLGSRLEDLISLAQGLSQLADLAPEQLTRRIEAGEVVHIPARPAATAPAEKPTHQPKADSAQASGQVVHIRTAGLEQLTQLPGIGPALAKRILDYRQAHPFQRLEDLQQVKGIGPKTFAKMKAQLAL